MSAATDLTGTKPLKEVDPEMYDLIKEEERRQLCGLELIASENFTSHAVMEAVGSCLTNKYSEGLPGKRYYGGNHVIDKVETLCQQRALQVFDCDPELWAVNVQPYSGSVGNFAAMTAVLQPNDRFMGLFLPDGGHLSHGFYRGHKAINISSKYFQSMPYHVDPSTGLIDYEDLAATAKRFCPKLIVAGSSAYPRDWDYAKIRQVCDDVGALLMVDIAHFSGLVASKLLRNPFKWADIVTTTTHKSLRSTRAAMIFCKKELEARVNSAVFPATQGGPHNHAIAGIAVALREALSPLFREYSRQVISNAQAMCDELVKLGHAIVTGGTDTHLLLWDVRPHGLTGSKVETLCDLVHITVNKNTVVGDKSAMNPGGIRLGSPAMTSRGLKEEDFRAMTRFLDEVVKIAVAVQAKSGSRKLKDFKACIPNFTDALSALDARVVAFAERFHMPGRQLE